MGKDKAISGGFLPGRVWSARLLIAVWTVALGIAAVHGQDGANGVREKGPPEGETMTHEPTTLRPLQVQTLWLLEGTAGEPYQAVLEVEGGKPPYQFALAKGLLPPGLALDPATGQVRGTPTERGVAHVLVQVTDQEQQTATWRGLLVAEVARLRGSGPVSAADDPLFRGFSCLFTIPHYWDYGRFTPQEACELPGKLFRARASAQHPRVSYSGGSLGVSNLFSFPGGRLHVAWQVRPPAAAVPGGRFSLVEPRAHGEPDEPARPWRVWCNREPDGKVVWHLETWAGGSWSDHPLVNEGGADGWLEVQLALDPTQLSVEINRQPRGTFHHDPYPEVFTLHFGSGQEWPDGGEVVSEYRSVYFAPPRYPYSAEDCPDGPEDLRPEDEALCYLVCPATPDNPRNSEGDLIALRDDSPPSNSPTHQLTNSPTHPRLLLVWTDYFTPAGHDSSPARLSGKISEDGGRTWGERFSLVEEDQRNIMSASLCRAGNGDLLLAYLNRQGGGTDGMWVRRSSDEGRTWSEPVLATPREGFGASSHYANNACLQRLSTGRIILSCRTYLGGVRWPYAVWSDDDGYTWTHGELIPDPQTGNAQNVNEPCFAELSDPASRRAGYTLLLSGRTTLGSQYFAYSRDGGQTWTKPLPSPLKGACSPAMIKPIPGTSDLLAIWNYGLTGRTPLNSAISSDGGRTWKNVKLVERSTFHGYCYTSLTFVNEQVYLTYMHYPSLPHLMRFEADPGYHDLRLARLPLAWFYRINAHLTVAAEPAGADLQAGDRIKVSWESCEPVGFVDLSLLRSDEVVALLQTGLVVNTRAYATRLTLPPGLPSGDDYRLLLSDSENPRVSTRSETFRIGR